MKKWFLFLIFISVNVSINGQIENRWQPDSIYKNLSVSKIYVYLNSPKDLSEIVEFDRTGKKIRSIKYTASYNRRTRKYKRIQKIRLYKYDSLNRLNMVLDSARNDSITFRYNSNGKLVSSSKNLGNFIFETNYYYNPFKSTTIRKKNSKIVYENTKEYDNEFYVKRSFGHSYKPKLKRIKHGAGGNVNTVAYSDYKDLVRYNHEEKIENEFDLEKKLIKSKIKSVFMNDRLNEFELNYKYYKNGLFKKILGYVPRHFKYEFYK